MGQLTIYLDDTTTGLLDKAVATAGVSRSSYVAGLIRQHAGEGWPKAVRGLAGAWDDDSFPEQEALRAGLGQDVARERL